MLEKLLNYQNVDSELRKIEMELGQSEERKKALSAQNFLKGVDDNVAKLDEKAEVLFGRYNAMTKLAGELSEQLSEYDVDDCENTDQAAYMRKKAAELIDQITALSDNVETLSAEINSVIKEFSQLVAKKKEARAVYGEYAPKYNELKASKESQMREIKNRLDKLAADIPSDVLEKYKQKRKDKIFPVLNEARIMSKHAYCRCGTELPGAAYDSLISGNVIECENCHRMLFIK